MLYRGTKVEAAGLCGRRYRPGFCCALLAAWWAMSLLVGFIIAGVVICGFSISDMVERVSFRLDGALTRIIAAVKKSVLLQRKLAANTPQPTKEAG